LQAGPFHASTNDRVDDAPGLGPDGPPGEGSGDDGRRKRRKAFFPRFSMCAGDFVGLDRRKPPASGSSSGRAAHSQAHALARFLALHGFVSDGLGWTRIRAARAPARTHAGQEQADPSLARAHS
jgi:hypothetical protein